MDKLLQGQRTKYCILFHAWVATQTNCPHVDFENLLPVTIINYVIQTKRDVFIPDMNTRMTFDVTPDTTIASRSSNVKTNEVLGTPEIATSNMLNRSDTYLSKNKQQIQSLLAIPLVHHNDIVGVLYLENNLITQAFPPETVCVFALLNLSSSIFFFSQPLIKTPTGTINQNFAHSIDC